MWWPRLRLQQAQSTSQAAALGGPGALRTVGGQVEAGQVGELEAQVFAQRGQVQVVQRLLLDLPAAQAG